MKQEDKKASKKIRLIPKGLSRRFSRTETQEVPAQVAIVGGGPAGMEAASVLAREGCQVLLFEARHDLAENILNKHRLFPDFSTSNELSYRLISGLDNPLVKVLPDTEIVHVAKMDVGDWCLTDNKGEKYHVAAVLLASGYQVFDARRKEELGYGIYPGVMTSLELESCLKEHRLLTPLREDPKRIVFLQCVGSRDEKVGNNYCSKVCCVTAVKQAIEAKRLLPDAEVYLFYMDLRMWGKGFEELYRSAQEQYNIRFVRGRISEASGTFDNKIQIKAEDTLLGQPLKLIADLLVLMVGMEPSCGTRNLAQCCGISGDYGFVRTAGPHLDDNLTGEQGLFVAGTCKRPMTIQDTIHDARSAALEIINYLS